MARDGVFFYDGKPDESGSYLVIMADGTELPGWYFMMGTDPIGPYASREQAVADAISNGIEP